MIFAISDSMSPLIRVQTVVFFTLFYIHFYWSLRHLVIWLDTIFAVFLNWFLFPFLFALFVLLEQFSQ